VFTARYALSPYIKQTRFVLKGLNNDEDNGINILRVVLGEYFRSNEGF
jgi:hypothetical protein